MHLTWTLVPVALAFLAIALNLLLFAGVIGLRRRHRQLSDCDPWPGISCIKPLAGLDDDLEHNLQTHLEVDYPGPWELLLGVRDSSDAAYPVAAALASKHPDRVRIVLQSYHGGSNPKVNQLISLTREARYDIVASSDSNARVHRDYLREHASLLSDERCGLTTQMYAGVGERSFGAACDNMTLISFACVAVAASDVLLRAPQVVGKSMVLRRSALEAIGGWESVQDVLAEDQRLGAMIRHAGYTVAYAPTAIENVQRSNSFRQFWDRQARWAMIRFRIFPGVWLEPLLNAPGWGLVAIAVAPRSWVAWGAAGATAVFSAGYTQLCARVIRGHLFAVRWIVFSPIRELAMLGVWATGMFRREVTWRGHRFWVDKGTHLRPRDASVGMSTATGRAETHDPRKLPTNTRVE